MIPDTSGPTSPASSPQLSLSFASSKTWQGICGLGSTWSPKTWSTWVTALRQDCLRRRKSVLLTAGNGSTYSPDDDKGTAWPTPDASVSTHVNQGGQEGRVGRRRPCLAAAAPSWATPSAHDGRRPGSDASSTQARNLKREAESWATPAARDWRSDSSQKSSEEIYGSKGRPLARQAWEFGLQAHPTENAGPQSLNDDQTSPQHWQTPTVLDGVARPYTYPSGDKTKAFPTLTGQAAGWPRPKLRLNPLFVEWLMGLPLGHTDLRPVATQSYQAWLRWHGVPCNRP